MKSLASAPCRPCCHFVEEFYGCILGIKQKRAVLDFGGSSNTLIDLMQWCVIIRHVLNACHMTESGTAQGIGPEMVPLTSGAFGDD